MKKEQSPKGISSFTLIKILKTFSPKEIIEFGKLISSPYFNNHSTLVILYNELKNHYPDFGDSILSKEYLFDSVNKGKKYDDRLFQKYLSRLNKLAEEYLNLIEIKKNKNLKEVNILHQLSKRELPNIYMRRIHEFEKSLELDEKLTEDFYFILHKLSVLKYNHFSGENYSYKHKNEVKGAYNNLINYFVLSSANYINKMMADRYSYNIPDEVKISGSFYDLSELEKNLKFLIKSTPASDRKRLLYLNLILNDINLNSRKEGFSAYRNLKELVFNNISMLSNDYLLFYIERLNIFCVLENSVGNTKYEAELFDNYKFLIENKLFYLDDVPDLGVLDFRAVLLTALRSGEIEWVEKFIVDSKSMIKKSSRYNFFHYGYSFLLFHKKNFSEALDHISMIKNEPLPITIDVYVLKIEIFYELGFFDSALALTESFRHYIHGNKFISEYLCNLFINFIKYFKQLLSLKKNPTLRNKEKLILSLSEINKIKEKKWLLEKLEEIK